MKIRHFLFSVLVLVMAFIGCASTKAVFQVKNAPEGIVLTFGHIPAETTRLFIHLMETGESENTISVFADIRGTRLDQVKKTGIVVCPFVQNGHNYNIGVSFDILNKDDSENWINAEITADNGIYTLNELALELNDSRTGVTLSAEPKFSNDVQFDTQRFRYIVTVKVDQYTSIGYSQLKDELEWEFLSGMLDDYKKDNINISGDFAAYVTACCNINYDNILWTVGVVNSKEFTVSL